MISPSQRTLPDNTTLTTDIDVRGGIRTRIPSKRAAAEPRLRPRGHWDRLFSSKLQEFKTQKTVVFKTKIQNFYKILNLLEYIKYKDTSYQRAKCARNARHNYKIFTLSATAQSWKKMEVDLCSVSLGRNQKEVLKS